MLQNTGTTYEVKIHQLHEILPAWENGKNIIIYTIFQEGDIFSSTTSLPYGPLNIQLIYKTLKQTNGIMNIYTSMHGIAKKRITMQFQTN